VRVKGLDGRTYNLDLTGHVPLGSEQVGSDGHERARKLLEKLFSLDRRLEEVTLPGTGSLRADFFLPARKLVAEVHGRQHYEFVPHFHKDRLGFMRAQARDRQKREWCELNNITYVELPDDESDDQWAARIRSAGKAEDGGRAAGGA
jgi:hypothetical protein